MGAGVMWRQWQWATTQKRLLDSYAALVVASHHMWRELVRHTRNADRVHVNALFPTCRPDSAPAQAPATPHVVFLGRMTALKGGDVLIRAVRHAEDRMRQRIRLTLLGDGPQRSEWQDLARTLHLADAAFPGWLGGSQRDSILRSASVAAMPSLWPEPFGLAGLDAGAFGVPTVAFNVGGVSEWLRDGVNGVCVDPPGSAAAFGDALAAVLSDPARLAALREGAQKVARELTVGAHLDRLEAVFARACEGPCASS
jgi:glycosyltransferase involved in cell wall biosynthesis